MIIRVFKELDSLKELREIIWDERDRYTEDQFKFLNKLILDKTFVNLAKKMSIAEID